MRGLIIVKQVVLALSLFVFLLGCSNDGESETETAVSTTQQPIANTPPPIPTQTPEPTRASDVYRIAIDAPSRFGRFAQLIDTGELIGFDIDQFNLLAPQLAKPHVFAVTPYEGMLAGVANGEFDAAISALPITDTPPAGISFTQPYHEVGQVLIALANEQEIKGVGDVQPEMQIGAVRYEAGESAVRTQLAAEPITFDTTTDLLQALIDRQIRVAVIDSDNAQRFATLYDKQLLIVGGNDKSAWLAPTAYGIAVASDNSDLLSQLNQAIEATRPDAQNSVARWLVNSGSIEAGESLVGTFIDELVIGLATQTPLAELYAGRGTFNPVAWEIAANIGSGLYALDSANNILPVLATQPPTISEDGLEYTIPLRPDVTFPNGNTFSAGDVRWSVLWASGQGNFLINNYLKDTDENGLADDDSVQVVDDNTIKFTLSEPFGFFPQLLATPAYTIVDGACEPVFNFDFQSCDGFGKYNVAESTQNRDGTVTLLKLQASPDWQGEPVAFERLEVRIYQNTASMRDALALGALDVAWSGLSSDDVESLATNFELSVVNAPARFKSYLVFVHDTPPWDNRLVREAAAWAVNREALSAVFPNNRKPLLSPVLDHIAGHSPTFPERNVDKAIELLTAAGFSRDNPVPISIWYNNDGRYSDQEADYAAELKANLDETGIFQVALESAATGPFLVEKSNCNYPAFLLGWPPKSTSGRYTDPSLWLDYFVYAVQDVCSNYVNETMTELLDQAIIETDLAKRNELYQEIQTLWAKDLPTLPLVQEFDSAVARAEVAGIEGSFDALGLMQYGRLSK